MTFPQRQNTTVIPEAIAGQYPPSSSVADRLSHATYQTSPQAKHCYLRSGESCHDGGTLLSDGFTKAHGAA